MFPEKINKTDLSRLAFEECLRLKNKGEEDISENWRLICKDKWLYEYCIQVKDRSEVSSKIKKSLLGLFFMTFFNPIKFIIMEYFSWNISFSVYNISEILFAKKFLLCPAGL